jgi:thiamine biosynthesis protein ThiI
MTSVVVHYQEIALKKGNRSWFVSRLARNIKIATADVGVTAVRILMGRFELVLDAGADWETVRRRVERVFGIANFARARRVTLDVDRIAEAILHDMGDLEVESFRVSARRADKRFPLTSPQIEREVGGRIQEAKGWRVDLSAPELVVHLEALTDEAFFFFRKEPGPGGLPSGVSGKVACLLSGGIDSPVAAYRLMKRGCNVQLIHFHSYPITSRTSMEKVREIVDLLTMYQLHSRLAMVAFGDLQRRVVLSAPERMRVVIYRRLMMRIADRLARSWGAQALVTGEAVGQVASQTLENIAAINAVTTLPVLRPLVGMDKNEIVAEAQQLGTYPISIIPDEDCCQLFTPRHPATRSKLRDADRAEQELDIEELVSSAVEAAEVEDFHFPVRT